MNKNIKIYWHESSSDCDLCGSNTRTSVTIEHEGKIFTDSSGGCFGNKYDQCNPSETVKNVLELMGFKVELEYTYGPE